MAQNNATSPKPNGQYPKETVENTRQHHRLAEGQKVNQQPSGGPSTRW